jgi:hypothetical protein
LTCPGKPKRKPALRAEAHCGGAPAAHAKMPAAPHNKTMDIERVNAIGTLLADLTARTIALRGYL